MHRVFYVIHVGMTYVLAFDQEDHILGDVAGMISDAFERARGPRCLQRTADGAWILHHVRDDLTHDGLVFTIHHLLFLDRKSTRLNSSHTNISYAVFCLKKKNTEAMQSHSALHLFVVLPRALDQAA